MFRSGSRHQVIDVPHPAGLEANYELFPFQEIAQDQALLRAVGAHLVLAAEHNEPLKYFLPDVKERYSKISTATKAIERAARKSEMLAWVIQRAGVHSERSECNALSVFGVATLHEGQQVSVDGQRQKGTYALAAFWTDRVPLADQDSIASALLNTVPKNVLRDPSRVFAAVDDPIKNAEDEIVHDPCEAFINAGRYWVKARLLDGSAAQNAEGIVTKSTTKLFVPTGS